jgi:hypothetical protein
MLRPVIAGLLIRRFAVFAFPQGEAGVLFRVFNCDAGTGEVVTPNLLPCHSGSVGSAPGQANILKQQAADVLRC